MILLDQPTTTEPKRPSTADLEQLQAEICRRFVHRIHDFHVHAKKGGLILEGRTKTFYGKQLILSAVMQATEVPIVNNNIVVG